MMGGSAKTVALVAALALAGCFGTPVEAPSDPREEPTTQDPDQRPSSPTVISNATNTSGPAAPAPAGAPWQWPDLDAATIRPGVQLVIGTSQCTSNFVFLDRANTTVYLGTAAHCFTDGGEQSAGDQDGYENGCDPAAEVHAIGKTVDIEGASRPGTLVYTSWGTMQARNETHTVACDLNDFAVIAIDPEDAHKVHPAMKDYGGPTGMTTFDDVAVEEKVLTFGSTGLRDAAVASGPEVVDAREGYVIAKQNNWEYVIYTATPGLPGDSGSAVILADGPALGVLATLYGFPYAGANGVVDLERVLGYAREHGRIDLQLATWEILDDGMLP